MTDLLDHPTTAAAPVPPAPPYGAPFAPPNVEVRDASDPPRDPQRSRFLTGVALGAVVGAFVSGAMVAALRAGDGGTSTVAPVVTTVSHSSGASTGANTIATIVANARPSIVSIHDDITQTDIFGQQQTGQAAGTGFVLSADGYIVTNDHVIDGATNITVNFDDGSTAKAKVVGADPNADLAVLKVSKNGLVPLPQGHSSELQVGDELVAIGNALDLSGEPTVTSGIVSATGRALTEPNGVHLVNLIQTDTAINPGNSGGPLLDMNGDVVGINTAISGQGQNIGFAISIDPATAIIDQLRQGKVPDHALLGVSTEAVEGDSGGARITDISVDSAAAGSALRVGDVIVQAGDSAITTPDDLGTVIASHQPGDSISITYRRDGEQHTIDVTLGVRPADG
ncbi:MAG: trypsin-like peptidase domain-containing protein [Acidimicrobiales bacterium]